jgi:hypothetical protein
MTENLTCRPFIEFAHSLVLEDPGDVLQDEAPGNPEYVSLLGRFMS